MKKVLVAEEMRFRQEWANEAETQTMETLPAFMNHLMNDYEHSYESIVYALAACALGAVYAAMNSAGPRGGISYFQSCCVMWSFIRSFIYNHNECSMRLLNYDEMLYPQCEDIFTSIQADTWQRVQEKAKEKLAEYSDADPEVRTHWQSIVDGYVPFGYHVG